MQELLHQLHIDPKVMAAQVTGFILLWILLAKVLFRPVLALLHAREQEIKTTYEQAHATRSAADELKSELEQRLAGIEAEARSRIQAAVKDAQDAKDDILADARTRAEGIRQRGQEDLAREREKTLAALREQVVDISLSAAGKLIEASLDEAKHRKLVKDFVNRIGSAK